ncbi:MAG: c-type cytochrome, partial [Proteobacteria bacterium]|nr:c-type cytochrome [Pseudomonadota bacterium]
MVFTGSRLALITYLLSSFLNTAFADPVIIKLAFEPDLKNGQRIYEICASCHLPEGWGNNDGAYPQIAGQHQNVLIQQLLDIRSGRRENPTMYPFVQERTIGGYQSLADVVVYISTLPMHPQHRKGPWNDYS